MLLGWKPMNQTMIYEFIDIDFLKWTHIFGKAVGEGMIYGLKSDAIHFFSRFQDIVPIYYLEN